MYKSTYAPFLFLFFLFFFPFHSVFSLSFHLFSSRYSKKIPVQSKQCRCLGTSWIPNSTVAICFPFVQNAAVSLRQQHLSRHHYPQLYRCHLLSICREIKLVKTQLGGVISNTGQDIMNPQLYRCHLLFYSHIYKFLF